MFYLKLADKLLYFMCFYKSILNYSTNMCDCQHIIVLLDIILYISNNIRE